MRLRKRSVDGLILMSFWNQEIGIVVVAVEELNPVLDYVSALHAERNQHFFNAYHDMEHNHVQVQHVEQEVEGMLQHVWMRLHVFGIKA